MAMVWSSSDGVVIHYVLWVLWKVYVFTQWARHVILSGGSVTPKTAASVQPTVKKSGGNMVVHGEQSLRSVIGLLQVVEFV